MRRFERMGSEGRPRATMRDSAGTVVVRDPFIPRANERKHARFRPMNDERIEETPRESRQATKTPTQMRYVLGIGIAGVVIGFIIAYLAVFT